MKVGTLLIIALGLGLLYGLFTVGSPFLFAIVIAILLEPIVKLVAKWCRGNRTVASVIVCTLFTLLMLFIVYLLGAKIISELIALTKKAPGYIRDLNQYFKDLTVQLEDILVNLPSETAEQVRTWAESITDSLTSALTGLIGSLSGALINAAKVIPNLFVWSIVFTVALYLFSMSMPRLKQSFLQFFADESQEKVSTVMDDLHRSIFGFIQSQIILCAIVYVMSLLGFLLLGVDYPMVFALIVMLVDLMPIVGVGTALVPWAIFNLVTGDFYLAVGLFVMFLVITVVRRIVEPKVLGDSVGIGALSALISLYIGLKLVGVIGIFLGPLVVIIYQAMRKVGLLQIKIKFDS